MLKNKQVMSGFTLLEAMISMVIVSVGLLAMAQLLLVTMKQNSHSEARMEGATLAKNLLTEASLLIGSAADCVALMPVQLRDNSNSARAGQTVSVSCTVLGPDKYLLEATVTDIATGKVTKNQKIYSNTTGALGGIVVASAGTEIPVATTPTTSAVPAKGSTPAGGVAAWFDVGQVASWLLDNKWVGAQKINSSNTLSAYAPVSSSLLIADAGTVFVQDTGAYKDAQSNFDSTVGNWSSDSKKSGEKNVVMFEDLAKTGGC